MNKTEQLAQSLADQLYSHGNYVPILTAAEDVNWPQWRYCEPCELVTPVLHSNCLVCGSRT